MLTLFISLIILHKNIGMPRLLNSLIKNKNIGMLRLLISLIKNKFQDYLPHRSINYMINGKVVSTKVRLQL